MLPFLAFFVQTFIRSLIESGHLKYDLRAKSWTWDIDSISVEKVTPNVLDLISAKMTNLSQNVQVCVVLVVQCAIRLILLYCQANNQSRVLGKHCHTHHIMCRLRSKLLHALGQK